MMRCVSKVLSVSEGSSHASDSIGNHDHNDGTNESSNRDDDMMIIMWIRISVCVSVTMSSNHDVMVVMNIWVCMNACVVMQAGMGKISYYQ